MNINTQTQAVLLLTAWLSAADRTAKPLTPAEWGRFAHWLKERGSAPDVLLSQRETEQVLEGWCDRSITLDRISNLLGRSAALGFAVEKWERAGLWVMTRSDLDYPPRLKKQLKFDAPPVLFGCGNRQLLGKGGVAIVGSRDASESDLGFTSELGKTLASQGVCVISGGARGVDEAAMFGALEHEGTIVGVLADSLLRAATSARYRNGLMAKNAVLISTFNPEAGFDVGNAMGRNRYVYCLSDAAIVIASAKGKGGTWNGAVENLRSAWVPLWVKKSGEATSGCTALVELGARWLPDLAIEISDLVAATTDMPESHDLFTSNPGASASASLVKESASTYVEVPETTVSVQQATGPEIVGANQQSAKALYDHFLGALANETRHEALTVEVLCERLDLHKLQLDKWLKRAAAEGSVTKLTRPVRYQAVSLAQAELFRMP